LARAVVADQAHGFALEDIERDIADRMHGTETARNVADFNDAACQAMCSSLNEMAACAGGGRRCWLRVTAGTAARPSAVSVPRGCSGAVWLPGISRSGGRQGRSLHRG